MPGTLSFLTEPSTATGEEVALFTLAESPDFAQNKEEVARQQPKDLGHAERPSKGAVSVAHDIDRQAVPGACQR